MGGRALDLASQQSEAVVEALHKAQQQAHDRDQQHDALKQEVPIHTQETELYQINIYR
jgi:Arc/MetJ-type ribon-helix-helix transcriptional regulator